jgi:hypothetical protein
MLSPWPPLKQIFLQWALFSLFERGSGNERRLRPLSASYSFLGDGQRRIFNPSWGAVRISYGISLGCCGSGRVGKDSKRGWGSVSGIDQNQIIPSLFRREKWGNRTALITEYLPASGSLSKSLEFRYYPGKDASALSTALMVNRMSSSR